MLSGKVLALSAGLLIAAAAQAAPVYSDSLVNFGVLTGTQKNWPTTTGATDQYYNWYGSANDVATVAAKALTNRTSGATDLTLSATFGGFTSSDRGNGVNYTVGNFTYYGNTDTTNQPSNPMQSYFADNINALPGTRDGLMTFRIASTEQYHFQFTVVGSYHGTLADGNPPASGQPDAETLANIGGTYATSRTSPFSGSFTGGTTVAYNPSGEGNMDRGYALISGDSTWNASLSKYVIDLQIGVGATGNVAAINALRIETSAVPEPAMLSVLGASGVLLSMRRRQRA